MRLSILFRLSALSRSSGASGVLACPRRIKAPTTLQPPPGKRANNRKTRRHRKKSSPTTTFPSPKTSASSCGFRCAQSRRPTGFGDRRMIRRTKTIQSPKLTGANVSSRLRDKIADSEKQLDVMQRELDKDQVQYYSDPQKALMQQHDRSDINDKTRQNRRQEKGNRRSETATQRHGR